MVWTRYIYYRSLFLLAGIWNIGMGLLVWMLGVLVPETAFESYGMTVPPTLFFAHAMLGFIVVFGIGYIIVSWNLDKNRGIVILGVISKLIFFVDCVVSVSLGQASTILLVNGTIDAFFAILFVEFLNWIRTPPKTRWARFAAARERRYPHWIESLSD